MQIKFRYCVIPFLIAVSLYAVSSKQLALEEVLIQNPIVEVKTSKGDFFIELLADQAPLTVDNFLGYVRDGYYNNTLIHRVIDGFIIQMGGYDHEFKPKPTAKPIKNESKNGFPNTRGTVSMALTTDSNSGASQFFVNVADNPDLDYDKRKQYGHTVFGIIKDGMPIIDRIKKVKTRKVMVYSELYKRDLPIYNVPETDIVVHSIRVIREATVVKKSELN